MSEYIDADFAVVCDEMGDITVNNANGYSGTLHGKELTVSYHGKVVVHTYRAAPTNEEELNECLRQMPEFLRREYGEDDDEQETEEEESEAPDDADHRGDLR